MADDPRDVRVAELEAEVLALKAENDRLRQDNADLLPEADATSWALNEMNMALARARTAELALKVAERHAEKLVRENERNKPKADTLDRNTIPAKARGRRPAPVAPTPAVEPQPLREAPPSGLHGSMADVLGFPKEGR